MYDYSIPYINRLSDPRSPTSETLFPLTSTHVLLILLVPSLLLPLVPSSLIAYILLPLGVAPPIFFHPNLNAFFLSLHRHSTVLRFRAKLQDAALTDALDDRMGGRPIGRVEVWENERLDPAVAAKPPSGALHQARGPVGI